jgi:hypothetical protein
MAGCPKALSVFLVIGGIRVIGSLRRFIAGFYGRLCWGNFDDATGEEALKFGKEGQAIQRGLGRVSRSLWLVSCGGGGRFPEIFG